MDGSWGATNRPPLGSNITPWRVTLWRVLVSMHLFAWKFGNFSIKGREWLQALWSSCDPSFWLLGKVAFFLTMRKRHPQGRCPSRIYLCLNLPQAMESCRYGSKFVYEKRPRILVTFSIDKSHLEVAKKNPPRK